MLTNTSHTKTQHILRISKSIEFHNTASLSWDQVCPPKREGGLGLKRVEDWNKAAAIKHFWNLFSQAGSVWLAWLHGVLLKGTSFWAVKVP